MNIRHGVSTKQFRVRCLECGKYPQFMVTEKKGKELIENHKKIIRELFHEEHKPILVRV